MDRHLPSLRPLKPSDFSGEALDLFYRAVCRWETLSADDILTECAMLFLVGTHLAEKSNANPIKEARESPEPSSTDPTTDQQIA